MTGPHQATVPDSASEFAASLRRGVLLGAAVMVLALPPALDKLSSPAPAPAHASSAASLTAVPAAANISPAATPQLAARSSTRPVAVRRADFGRESASAGVRKMADWVVHSGDHRKMSFIIIDKKDAKVFVFTPAGRLKAVAPALLGEAVGDDTAPGIGDKPLAQVLPQEKTTPAGRFVAEVGMSSTRGEDVVWVDYDSAVSMHRVLKVEQRVKRLATPTPADNRMSFGCINVPPQFYEKVLRPTVDAGGAVIYVLPETRSLRQTFTAFYDVDSQIKMAAHSMR